MKGIRSPFIPLAALGLVFGWAAFRYGAVLPETWKRCAVALALLALLYPVFTSKDETPPALSRALKWLVVALPGYVALQLVPIPLAPLRVLSPAKARLIDALSPIIADITADPLAVNPPATFQHLIRIGSYVLVFLLARQLVFRFRRTPWMCTIPLVAVATVEAIVGLIQYAKLDALTGLIRGTYINRNHFAFMLELAFPFALAGVILLARRDKPSWYLRLLPAAFVATVILFGIVSSFSRMGLISALFTLAIIGTVQMRTIREGRSRWVIPAGIVVLLLASAVLFFPSNLAERFNEFSKPGTAAIDRRSIWTQTLRVASDYRWFGCGLGGYRFTYLKYKTEWPLWTTDFVHNDYLQGFAELGIVGSIPVLLLLMLVLRATGRGMWRGDSVENRSLALACAAAIAAILMHSFVDFNLYIPANAMEAAWICGTAVAIPDLEKVA